MQVAGGERTLRAFSYSLACALCIFSTASTYSSRYATACFQACRRSERRPAVCASQRQFARRQIIPSRVRRGYGRPGDGWEQGLEHTLVGSTSGTASSLMLVVAREGSCVEVGEAMVVSCRAIGFSGDCVLWTGGKSSGRGFVRRGGDLGAADGSGKRAVWSPAELSAACVGARSRLV